MDTFTGTIERVTYYNPENGYSVLKVMPDSRLPEHYTQRDGRVAVVGVMPELSVGEDAQFEGDWIEDPKYGAQMKAEKVTPIVPTSEQGLTRYLSSGIVRGIGPVTAKKIVDHFGITILDILNKEPERLHEVPRLKSSLADKLAEAWKDHYADRQVMIGLQGYGISARIAKRIFDHYGSGAVEQVQDDPYTLSDEVFGIGFIRADEIAQKMGVEVDSPKRIRAGLTYALNKLANDGHTFAPRDELMAKTIELLEIEGNPDLFTSILERQLFTGDLVADMIDIKGEQREAIYLPMYHKAETGSARRLDAMRDMPSPIIEQMKKTKWKSFLSDIAKNNNVSLTDQQQGAVKAALTSKISVLTGGPGTGKTTTLQMVITALEEEKFTFALASPTGRAAKRLSEATEREASTIHRLLGFNPGFGFDHDEDFPLEIDMLVVDEASMIDLLLFNSMVRALKPETHLMLVGDIDQLPSVGAGNVLRDVIDSQAAYVTRLETIFRQSEDSHIILNAHRINQGQSPLMDNKSSDFFFFREEDPYEAAERVIDVVKNRIPSKFGFNPMNDVQVIAPMYRGTSGINALNTGLQTALNGSKRLAQENIGGRIFRVGDKVMQTRNDYDKDVFNGDIGRIHSIDPGDNSLEVVMDGRYVFYEFSEVDVLIHAYCISIHKSQGSEYPVVVIPLLNQHYIMLQRNLLYTAITRAKKMVVLVGNRKAVELAVHNNKVEKRNSGLLARLRG
jgi:exodeoxyribonuclease V alpha subunit